MIGIYLRINFTHMTFIPDNFIWVYSNDTMLINKYDITFFFWLDKPNQKVSYVIILLTLERMIKISCLYVF